MSKVTKRKRILNDAVCDDYELPKENQSVVKVLKSKGNNLHLITTPSGEEYLVSMPTKFRKVIWVKRGDYLLVEPIAEGDKVKGEIVKIMNKDSIKYYIENNVWPKEFNDKKEEAKENNEYGNDNLFVNGNINRAVERDSDSDSSYESDSNCDDDEIGK